MRRKFYIILLLAVPLFSFGQKLKEYKASNGITYRIGDTVKLGRGSDPNGNFMYVQIGGWGKAFTYESGKGAAQYDLDRNFAGTAAVIKKIRNEKAHGADRIVFTVGLGNISNYDMYIEYAIATCEIADCKKNLTMTAEQPKASNAEELAKYKKLLDQGAITKAEYEAVKKKLLNL